MKLPYRNMSAGLSFDDRVCEPSEKPTRARCTGGLCELPQKANEGFLKEINGKLLKLWLSISSAMSLVVQKSVPISYVYAITSNFAWRKTAPTLYCQYFWLKYIPEKCHFSVTLENLKNYCGHSIFIEIVQFFGTNLRYHRPKTYQKSKGVWDTFAFLTQPTG